MRRMGRPSPRPSLLQPGGGGTTTSDADSQAQAVTDDADRRVRQRLHPWLAARDHERYARWKTRLCANLAHSELVRHAATPPAHRLGPGWRDRLRPP